MGGKGKTNCVDGKGTQIAWAARGNKLRGRQGKTNFAGGKGKTNCVDGKGKQIAWAAKVPYNINSQRLRAARYLPNCLGKTGGKVCGRQGQTNCVGDTSKNIVCVEQAKNCVATETNVPSQRPRKIAATQQTSLAPWVSEQVCLKFKTAPRGIIHVSQGIRFYFKFNPGVYYT